MLFLISRFANQSRDTNEAISIIDITTSVITVSSLSALSGRYLCASARATFPGAIA